METIGIKLRNVNFVGLDADDAEVMCEEELLGAKENVRKRKSPRLLKLSQEKEKQIRERLRLIEERERKEKETARSQSSSDEDDDEYEYEGDKDDDEDDENEGVYIRDQFDVEIDVWSGETKTKVRPRSAPHPTFRRNVGERRVRYTPLSLEQAIKSMKASQTEMRGGEECLRDECYRAVMDMYKRDMAIHCSPLDLHLKGGTIEPASYHVTTAKAKADHAKNAMENGEGPSLALLGLAMVFAKKRKEHFWLDAVHIVKTMCQELKISMREFLERRYLVCKTTARSGRNDRNFNENDRRAFIQNSLAYRKNNPLLLRSGMEHGNDDIYRHLSKSINLLYMYLTDFNLLRHYNSADDTYLMRIPVEQSLLSKIILYVLYVHMAMGAVRYVFQYCEPFRTWDATEKNYSKEEKDAHFQILFDLTDKIFCDCADQKTVANTLYNISCKFESEGDTETAVPDCMEWMENPGMFVNISKQWSQSWTIEHALFSSELALINMMIEKGKRLEQPNLIYTTANEGWAMIRWQSVRMYQKYVKAGDKNRQNSDKSVVSNCERRYEIDRNIAYPSGDQRTYEEIIGAESLEEDEDDEDEGIKNGRSVSVLNTCNGNKNGDGSVDSTETNEGPSGTIKNGASVDNSDSEDGSDNIQQKDDDISVESMDKTNNTNLDSTNEVNDVKEKIHEEDTSVESTDEDETKDTERKSDDVESTTTFPLSDKEDMDESAHASVLSSTSVDEKGCETNIVQEKAAGSNVPDNVTITPPKSKSKRTWNRSSLRPKRKRINGRVLPLHRKKSRRRSKLNQYRIGNNEINEGVGKQGLEQDDKCVSENKTDETDDEDVEANGYECSEKKNDNSRDTSKDGMGSGDESDIGSEIVTQTENGRGAETNTVASVDTETRQFVDECKYNQEEKFVRPMHNLDETVMKIVKMKSDIDSSISPLNLASYALKLKNMSENDLRIEGGRLATMKPNERSSIAKQVAILRQTCTRSDINTKKTSTFRIWPKSNWKYDDYIKKNCKSQFSNMKLASVDDVKMFSPTLIIHGEMVNVLLRCSPLEVYVARKLSRLLHGFECQTSISIDDITDIGVFNIPISAPVCSKSGLSVVRPIRHGNKYFPANIEQMMKTIDMADIFDFVLNYGDGINKSLSVDTTREGSQKESMYNYRVEFGVAGNSFDERTEDEKKRGERGKVSGRLLGLKYFRHFEKRNGSKGREKVQKLCTDLGKLFDMLSDTSDKIRGCNIEDHPCPFFSDSRRYQKFAVRVRELLRAKRMRNEWCSIQIKCINRGDVTDEHLDINNCSWTGYDVTQTLCFIYKDEIGLLWSIKFIANSRKQAGNATIPDFNVIRSALERQLNAINNDYFWLFANNVKGEYNDDDKVNVSAKDFRNFYLHDGMPWTTENIASATKKGDRVDCIHMRCLQTVSAIQRDLFLSGEICGIYDVRRCNPNILLSNLLELGIVACYQNSPKRFYYLCHDTQNRKPAYRPDTEKQVTNAFEYYHQAMEKFGSFVGGSDNRCSSTGIDFKEVYLTDYDDKVNGVMARVKREIISLCEWINGCTFEEDELEDRTKQRVVITIGEYRRKIDEVVTKLRNINTSSGKTVEIGVFRLLLLLQICALSGLYLEPHPICTKLVFASRHTGAVMLIKEHIYNYQQRQRRKREEEKLSSNVCNNENSTEDDEGVLLNPEGLIVPLTKRQRMVDDNISVTEDYIDYALGRFSKSFDLNDFDRYGAMDTIGCESQTKRREGNVVDAFIQGQCLHTLRPDGRPVHKPYEEKRWIPLFAMNTMWKVNENRD